MMKRSVKAPNVQRKTERPPRSLENRDGPGRPRVYGSFCNLVNERLAAGREEELRRSRRRSAVKLEFILATNWEPTKPKTRNGGKPDIRTEK